MKAPDYIWAWGHSGDNAPIRGFATSETSKGVKYVRADLAEERVETVRELRKFDAEKIAKLQEALSRVQR